MKLALTQLITATVTAALFLLLNRAGEKKISAYGRYLAGIILAASFLVPVKIPLIRIEVPEIIFQTENAGAAFENGANTPEIPENSESIYHPDASDYPVISTTEAEMPSNADGILPGTAEPTKTFSLTTSHFAGALWLCGALVMLLCTFFRYCKTAKALRRCGRAPTEREREMFLSVCRATGIKNPPELLVCPDESFRSSLTFGLRRETVLMSDKLSAEDFCVILGHELMHCRRKDSLVKAFLVLLRAAYWFNPVAYLFIRTMNRLCEQSCDEKFLAGKESEEKAHYLRLLVLSAAEKEHSNKLLFNAFKGGNTQMKKRITNILQNKNKKGAAIVISFALVAAILSAVVYAVAVPVAAEPSQNEGGDAATTENAVFLSEEDIKSQIAEWEKEGLEDLDEETKEGVINYFYNNHTVYGLSQGQIFEISNQTWEYKGETILLIQHNGEAYRYQGSARPSLAENGIGVNIVDQPDGTVKIEVLSDEELVNELFRTAFIFDTMEEEDAYYAYLESEEYKQWLERRPESPYWGTYTGPFLNLEKFTNEDGTYDYQKFYETRHLYNENWYDGTLDLEGEYWQNSQLFWKTLFARIGVTVE